MNNRKIGSQFEQELCNELAKNGWWAHFLSQNQTGQPADVIAVRNNVAVLIDCKVCADNRFALSRIECNQEGAMTLWKATGNAYCYFAMKLNDDRIYMVPFDDLQLRELHGQRTITESEFPRYETLAEWLTSMEGAG